MTTNMDAMKWQSRLCLWEVVGGLFHPARSRQLSVYCVLTVYLFGARPRCALHSNIYERCAVGKFSLCKQILFTVLAGWLLPRAAQFCYSAKLDHRCCFIAYTGKQYNTIAPGGLLIVVVFAGVGNGQHL